MTLPSFTLHRPGSLREATAVLAEHGEDAAVYMGGTELLLVMKLGLAQPRHLVDCKRVPELHGVVSGEQHLDIGAGVTHRQLERDPAVLDRLPEFARLEAGVANVRVRTAGTLGGNLCFAEPHSDPATLLSALGAHVEVVSADGFRRLPLEEFFVGPLETVLRPGEVMARIRVPVPPPDTVVRYERLKFRERPVANVAVVRNGSDVRVVVGAVGSKATRATGAERILREDPTAADAAGDAAAEAVQPYEDLDGSADYKRHLVKVLVRRAMDRNPPG